MITELFTKGYDSQNEDYCKVVEFDGCTLVTMADGMGGLSLGADAAECVCNSISEYVSRNLNVESHLEDAFRYADCKLHEVSIANHSNMGAAVTSLIETDNVCEIAGKVMSASIYLETIISNNSRMTIQWISAMVKRNLHAV